MAGSTTAVRTHMMLASMFDLTLGGVSSCLGDGEGNAQLSMVTVEAVDLKSSSVTSSLVVGS